MVKSKIYELCDIKDFQDKNEVLSNEIEEFEEKLSKELKKDFYDVVKNIYEIEKYYLVLAYYIGKI